MLEHFFAVFQWFARTRREFGEYKRSVRNVESIQPPFAALILSFSLLYLRLDVESVRTYPSIIMAYAKYDAEERGQEAGCQRKVEKIDAMVAEKRMDSAAKCECTC